jgi:hypothetical protein
MADDQQ